MSASSWPSCAAKFEPDPARPRYFLTQPGLGVRFVPDLEIEVDEPVSA